MNFKEIKNQKIDLTENSISGDIVIENRGVVIFGGVIRGNVTIKAEKAVVEDCKIDGNVTFEGAAHSIIAKCEVNGEIALKNCCNCVVLLNSAGSVTACGNTNAYIVENTLSSLALEGNNYLLADGNICESVISSDNVNFNGDNITDTDARLEFGADEALLPHANKELFIGVERDEYISAPDSLEGENISEYIMRCAKGGIVIVPPGAYVSPAPIILEKESSGSTVYAYGALQEMVPYGLCLSPRDADNLTVKGLVTSYVQQPCGQVTILEVIDDRTYIVIPYASSIDGFGKTDPSFFSTGFTDIFEKGKIYPWAVIGGAYEIKPNGDRTYTLTLAEEHPRRGELYKGDRIACRLVGPDKTAILPLSCKNFVMKDTFLYGHSACLAMAAHGTCDGILAYRWYNGCEAPRLIDRETYDFYRAIEKKYGVEGEVYIDSLGRYRGGQPLICTSDATHINGCVRGADAVSCLFEGMCDDGSNQRSSSARLKSLTDNRDGTATLIYKGSVPEVYCLHHFNESLPEHHPASCAPFKIGDRILVYTSTGVTVCDTFCLSDEEIIESYEFTLTPPNLNPRHYTDTYRRLTIASADVNFSALEGFDLDDVGYEMKHKVLVDNLSRNSAGFKFDNVMIRDTRSRGILVKTVGADIRNCTFRNLGHTGILLSVEFVWGESTVSQDIVIKNCLFDNIGFIGNSFMVKAISPIAIKGLSSTVDEKSLLYKNILIEGNKFVNNRNHHFITVNSAQNVRIKNNVFEDSDELSYIDGRFIDIETSMNIEISGNKYPEYLGCNISRGISAVNFKNVYGADINLEGDIE